MFEKHIKIFNEISKIYEDLGDDHRATAYHNIAKNLELLTLENLTEKSKRKVDEITKTGKSRVLESLKKDRDLMDRVKLSKVLGVGPKMAENLVKKDIRSFSSLKKSNVKLTSLQKMGVKYHPLLTKKPSKEVFTEIVKIILHDVKGIESLTIAGSYRTGKKEPSDIDLIVVTRDGSVKEVEKVLNEKNILQDYAKSGPEDILGIAKILGNYYRIDIKATSKKYYAAYQLYFGSGKYFSKYIRGVAKEKGYKLNQYGIENIKTGEFRTFRSEKSIFKFLKLNYLTPSERVKYF